MVTSIPSLLFSSPSLYLSPPPFLMGHGDRTSAGSGDGRVGSRSPPPSGKHARVQGIEATGSFSLASSDAALQFPLMGSQEVNNATVAKQVDDLLAAKITGFIKEIEAPIERVVKDTTTTIIVGLNARLERVQGEVHKVVGKVEAIHAKMEGMAKDIAEM